MIYLVLSILCSASLAIMFKFSEIKGYDRNLVTTANYLVATIVAIITFQKTFNPSEFSNINFSKFISEFRGLGPDSLLSVNGTIIMSTILGLIMGIAFLMSFIYFQKCIKDYGAGVSSIFVKFGILMPMTISIFLWHEVPTPVKWVGIILSLFSIVLINIDFGSSNFKLKKDLIILFFYNGIASLGNKVFQKYCIAEYKSYLLFVVFLIALLFSLVILLKNKKPFSIKPAILGCAIGVPNLLSTFFLIKSLSYYDTSVVFPINSSATIVVIALGSALLFNETFKKKERYAIALTVLSIVLVNM